MKSPANAHILSEYGMDGGFKIFKAVNFQIKFKKA
jgi:hypothetical protein